MVSETKCFRCSGKLPRCSECKDYWEHQCPDCGLTNNGRDALENDNTLQSFLNAHPLTPEEERKVNIAVIQLRERLRLSGEAGLAK